MKAIFFTKSLANILQHTKRPALQYKQVGVLRMAFRARKVFGSFEKQPPELNHEFPALVFLLWLILSYIPTLPDNPGVSRIQNESPGLLYG